MSACLPITHFAYIHLFSNCPVIVFRLNVFFRFSILFFFTFLLFPPPLSPSFAVPYSSSTGPPHPPPLPSVLPSPDIYPSPLLPILRWVSEPRAFFYICVLCIGALLSSFHDSPFPRLPYTYNIFCVPLIIPASEIRMKGSFMKNWERATGNWQLAIGIPKLREEKVAKLKIIPFVCREHVGSSAVGLGNCVLCIVYWVMYWVMIGSLLFWRSRALKDPHAIGV